MCFATRLSNDAGPVIKGPVEARKVVMAMANPKNKVLSLVIAGLSAFAFGCSDADIEASDFDDPLYGPMAGGSDGTNGQNSLRPDSFIAYRLNLYYAATQDLADYNSSTQKWTLASNAYTSALKSSEEGRDVLKYAIKCAVPVGTTVSVTVITGAGSTKYDFAGEGFLTTTGDWLNGGLTVDQTEDMFECMLAHMNHYTVVDINLAGPNVRDDPDMDTSPFVWEEALWQSTIDTTGSKVTIDTQVWPLGGFSGCPGEIDELETRVCGTSAGGGSCGLTIQTDLATACAESQDGWRCNGDPVVKSRLKTIQVPELYPGCI